MSFLPNLRVFPKLLLLVLLMAGAAAVPLAAAVLAPGVLWIATGIAWAAALPAAILIASDLACAARAAERAARHLAAGDLDTAGIAGVPRGDELGLVLASLGRLARTQSVLHAEIRALADGTAEAPSRTTPARLEGAFADMAGRLGEARATIRRIGEQATQVAVAAGQASTAVGHVSVGAQEQTGDLDLVVNAIGQSAQAIVSVSESTRNASDMVKAAAGFTEKGKAEMARLRRVSETVAENSRRIGRITEAITQIAVKTNILSVNASIEAARAGEQGKGFEVVAEEVGKLADNAVESARQIADIVEAAATMAEEGMSATAEVGRLMDGIADRIDRLDKMFQSVAVAMEEQQASIKDIESNVANVRTVASSNAAASEEIAATILRLSRLAEETRQQVARFKAS